MDLGGEEDGGSNVARELHRRRQMLMQQTNLLGLGDGCHLAFQLGGVEMLIGCIQPHAIGFRQPGDVPIFPNFDP